MTEHKERQILLQLIGQRPRNTRVFCIGIGNEVNRPLLEQLAEDTGGLAAFVSRGDNFNRQARAFRRKLMHPAIADLWIKVDGVRVYDLAPLALSNLYHGAPVRLYGRYSGGGDALVTVTGTVRGQEITKSARMSFPERDTANPEIERMWAWKRIDQLLKAADRNGTREAVVDEVVQLGETFSIVSEYTSFLVLENDNAYKRWKIDRRNAQRVQRDRGAQKIRQETLALIRNKAVADIGPQSGATDARIQSKAQAQPAVANPQPAAPQTTGPIASRPRSQSRDFDFGTGPVGPLFVGVAWWLTRRKRPK
jgi:Ca-activated chloride channel family protein